MRVVSLIAALACAPGLAAAIEVGESRYAFVSELAAEGFAPFATSPAGNASFGMMKDTEMYLCFIADNIETQNQRQTVLLKELAGESPDRSVPNIPLVCVLTQ